MANHKMDIGAVQEMLANADFGKLGEYFTNLASPNQNGHQNHPGHHQGHHQGHPGFNQPRHSPSPASISPVPPPSYNPYHGYPHSNHSSPQPPSSPHHGHGGYHTGSHPGYTAPCCVNPACRHDVVTPPGYGMNQQRTPYRGSPNSGYNPMTMPRNSPSPGAIEVPYGRASVRRPGECRVYVGNLPMQTAQCELAALFSPFGELLEVFVLRRANPHTGGRGAFVRFARVADATQAVQSLDGLEWRGRRITVRLAPVGTSANDMIPAAGAFAALMGMFAQATGAPNGETTFARGSPMDLMQQLAPMMQEFMASQQYEASHSSHSSPAASPAPSPQPAQMGANNAAALMAQMQKMMQSMQGMQGMKGMPGMPNQFSSPSITPEPSPLLRRTPSPSHSGARSGSLSTAISEPSSVNNSMGHPDDLMTMDPSQVGELLPLLMNFLMSQQSAPVEPSVAA